MCIRDRFGTRPDEITLTLYRQADSQPGQSNSIGKTEVLDGLYSVAWDETSGNVWTYTITGKQAAVEMCIRDREEMKKRVSGKL